MHQVPKRVGTARSYWLSVPGREIDWRAYANKLVFCFGCGRFSLPGKGGKPPKRWTTLYQPHGDAPPGLLVCSDRCKTTVLAAMQKGPVHEPVEMKVLLMPVEERAAMMAEVQQLIEEMLEEQRREQEEKERATDDDTVPGPTQDDSRPRGPQG